MTEYALYVESGPRKRKTMVHVLGLLGCIARGPSTEAALRATPDAIRAFLAFLRRHSEEVETGRPFTTAVVAHVMEGPWLGNGNPAGGFAPDFRPLSAEDVVTYLRRLAWMRSDLLTLIRDLSREQLLAEPEGSGRSIYRIVEHTAESQGVYVRSGLGKVEGLAAAFRAVRQGPEALPSALTRLWQLSSARLVAMTEAERRQLVERGQVMWTARRMLRRMLEHDWEHLIEIYERLA